MQQVKDATVAAILGRIPDCSSPVDIQICGSRRGRSPYQQFIASCMKGKQIRSFAEAPQAMRECGQEWRQRQR